MKDIFYLSMLVHTAVGFTALVTFWLGFFSLKGGGLHRKAGFVFFFSTAALSLSSFVLAGINIYDTRAVFPLRNADSARQINTFYVLGSAMALTAAWNGLRVIRMKDNLAQFGGKMDIGFNLLQVGLGVAVAVYGFVCQNLFLTVAGGLFGPVTVWVYYVRQLPLLLQNKTTYIQFHLINMLVAGIFIHSAFLAGGAMEAFFPWLGQKFGLGLWFVTPALGTFLTYVMSRRYAPR